MGAIPQTPRDVVPSTFGHFVVIAVVVIICVLAVDMVITKALAQGLRLRRRLGGRHEDKPFGCLSKEFPMRLIVNSRMNAGWAEELQPVMHT